MSSLHDSVEQVIGELPSMPPVVAKILGLLNNEAVPNLMLADAIAHDPSLSARILKLANSASSGARAKIKSLDHAIGVVGRSAVREFALESSIRKINSSLGTMGTMLWENSVGCAIACRVIARSLRTIPMDEAYMAGLFFPVGKVVLVLKRGNEYQEILEAAPTAAKDLQSLEHEKLGLSHEMVAAALLDKWNMDASLVSGIQHCYSLKNECYDPQAFIISRIVNMANAFTEKLGIGHFAPRDQIALDHIFAAYLLHLTVDQVAGLFEEFQVAYSDDQAYYLG
jgi:HD-like signal output (HDOD) protein